MWKVCECEIVLCVVWKDTGSYFYPFFEKEFSQIDAKLCCLAVQIKKSKKCSQRHGVETVQYLSNFKYFR